MTTRTISFSKKDLSSLYAFLQGATLKGAASRSRTKIAQQVEKFIAETAEEETDLVKELSGEINDNGQFIFDGDNAGENRDKFNKEHKILLDEKVEVSEKSEGHFEKLTSALNNYDVDLSGQNAYVYDLLLDTLENTGE